MDTPCPRSSAWTTAARARGVSDGRDLLRECSSVLTLDTEGTVGFLSCKVRLAILKLHNSDSRATHQGIAATCLRKILQVDARALLEPSRYIESFLSASQRHPFIGYCYLNWHRHYRAAEASDDNLPIQLFTAIEQALGAYMGTAYVSRTAMYDFALDIAMRLGNLYDFRGLATFCHRTGATPTPSGSAHITSLTMNSIHRLTIHQIPTAAMPQRLSNWQKPEPILSRTEVAPRHLPGTNALHASQCTHTQITCMNKRPAQDSGDQRDRKRRRNGNAASSSRRRTSTRVKADPIGSSLQLVPHYRDFSRSPSYYKVAQRHGECSTTCC